MNDQDEILEALKELTEEIKSLRKAVHALEHHVLRDKAVTYGDTSMGEW